MAREFDINITLSDAALTSAGSSIEWLFQRSITSRQPDDFDLDLKYLDWNGGAPGEGATLAVDPAKEAMAVGSGFFGITCSQTCAVVAGGGNTCAATCSQTCAVVAGGGNTCAATCSQTCAVVAGGGNTCAATCSQTCQVIATCAQGCAISNCSGCGVAFTTILIGLTVLVCTPSEKKPCPTTNVEYTPGGIAIGCSG